MLVSDITPFAAELLKGLGEAIRDTGFELMIYSAGGRAGDHVGWERRYLSRLNGTLIDGAILVTPTVVGVHYGAPIVAVDPHTGPSSLPTVDSDNLCGARLVTDHLLALGHRRIAMITGREDLESTARRERGYREALQADGVPVDEVLLERGDYVAEKSRDAARRLLDRRHRPTGVFAASDVSAIATVEVARECGLEVPGDLSVAGFDNIPESALCSPPLTTVDQHIQELGRRAMRLLVRLIRDEPVDEIHITLPTELVVRQSTARANRLPERMPVEQLTPAPAPPRPGVIPRLTRSSGSGI